MFELRDRRLTEPDSDQPFEHEHYGSWVRMELLRSVEVERHGWVTQETTFSCPSRAYELTESIPVRAVDLKLA